MIRKENKLVITFRTTAQAMAMERCCKENGAPGRLIPVPRAISAGCGLAWAANPESKEVLVTLMEQHRITPEAVQNCMI